MTALQLITQKEIILGSGGVNWSVVELQAPWAISCLCSAVYAYNVVSENNCDVCLGLYLSSRTFQAKSHNECLQQ